MKDSSRTKQELIKELSILKNKIKKLQLSESDRKQAEEALRESEERYRTMFENTGTSMILIEEDMTISMANGEFVRSTGYSPDEIIGRMKWTDLVHPDDLGRMVEQHRLRRESQGSALPSYEFCYRTKSGDLRDTLLTIDVLPGTRKSIASLIDVTERKRAEETLLKSEEKYRNILKNIEESYYEVDLAGNLTFFNDSMCQTMGYTHEKLMGMNYRGYTSKENAEKLFQAFNKVYKTGKSGRVADYEVIKKDGTNRYVGTSISLRKDSSDKPIGFNGIIRDTTERKRIEAEILALSITDQLTGLHNRRGFLSLVGQQLKLSDRNKQGVQLYFADLDGLKWINDTLGHEEGDKALIEAATVFKETFRTSDIIARLGGDEFAALAIDTTKENSEIFTARLQSLIDTRNKQENRKYRLSISVGCSYYDPENPSSIDGLISSADKFMYAQKQNKKGILLQGASLSNSNPYTSLHDESKGK